MKYFAYGSNLCTKRLRHRKVESATFVAIGMLRSYRLHFHKRSTDGSGKCNAYFTDNVNDEIAGVVFEILPAEKMFLDSAEGLGKGYQESIVCIAASNAEYKCSTYTAEPSYIDGSLGPYSWYRDFVAAGAREHGLPETYIQSNILNVEAFPDPDMKRDARERRYLVS